MNRTGREQEHGLGGDAVKTGAVTVGFVEPIDAYACPNCERKRIRSVDWQRDSERVTLLRGRVLKVGTSASRLEAWTCLVCGWQAGGDWPIGDSTQLVVRLDDLPVQAPHRSR